MPRTGLGQEGSGPLSEQWHWRIPIAASNEAPRNELQEVADITWSHKIEQNGLTLMQVGDVKGNGISWSGETAVP